MVDRDEWSMIEFATSSIEATERKGIIMSNCFGSDGEGLSQDKMKEYVSKEIVAVKELRRDIDAITQRVKKMSMTGERGVACAKLIEATMWLGMDLKRINEQYPGMSENPYPSSKDPSNTKIEATADGLKM